MMANDPLERARRGLKPVSSVETDVVDRVENKCERDIPVDPVQEQKITHSEAKSSKDGETNAIGALSESNVDLRGKNNSPRNNSGRLLESKVNMYGSTLTSLDSTLNAKMEEARRALLSGSPTSIVLHATTIKDLAKAIESLRMIKLERIA
mmetsp:Transcript_14822/g.30054  ORF Transcript_14822/g.30054 Transcript_14822/m.30054 type:complete len:151 (+) Transcript_14822:186-638(+)